MKIEAIYESGVLRLLEPIDLAENTQVQVIVIPKEKTTHQKSPREILKEIADIPMEGKEEGFLGQEHEQFILNSPYDCFDAAHKMNKMLEEYKQGKNV